MTNDSDTTSFDHATAMPRKGYRQRKGYRPQGKRALGIVDRRTLAWRRRCEIAAVFTKALGGETALTDMLRAKIAEAAELTAVAEMTRASFLQGSGASADDVVRTSRTASLAERRLGIAERKPKPSLATYLAEKAEAP